MPRFTLSLVTVAVLVASTGNAFAQHSTSNSHQTHEQVQTNRGHEPRAQNGRSSQHASNNRARVGQQMNRQNVRVVNDWQSRGLARPNAGETYVLSGDDLLLVVASTLIVKALIN